MPTIKEHIEVVEKEINATGKRLETETLTADQIIEVANRMAQLGSVLHWLQRLTQPLAQPYAQPHKGLIKSIN